jgi:peptide-methionine (S)-S-oxide reductase
MIKEATFGAGCFWGVEESFRTTSGVIETEVGFMGGILENPSYEDVCYKNTGHAEVVHLKYDSEKISYENLLKKFFDIHDPTQFNRQGPDVGDQYRSVIFYYDDEQKNSALKFKKELQTSEKYGALTIATAIEKAKEFYKAEEYHQKYVLKTGSKVCH